MQRKIELLPFFQQKIRAKMQVKINTSYYANGQLNRKWYSADSYKQEGVKQVWYKNGHLWSNNYVAEGDEEEWHRNGQLFVYWKSKNSNVKQIWNDLGRIMTRLIYSNGNRSWIQRHWHDDGYLLSQLSCVDYERNGLELVWNADGKLIEERMYKKRS